MHTDFNSNTFEHDYIIATLQHLVTDLKTDKSEAQIIDKYASILTAYMSGKVYSSIKPEWIYLTNEQITNIGIQHQSLHQIAKAIQEEMRRLNHERY